MYVLELAFERATKNTVRYSHPDFGTVYVPNRVVNELGRPERITITLEPIAKPLELAA